MKLEIIKGKPWNADFTVVSDDGVTPEVLDTNTDSGTFTVSTVGDNPTIVIESSPLTIVDVDNGKFNAELTGSQTALLDAKVGFAEDKYNSISNYIGILDLTLAAGNRHATVPLYVKDIGV